MKAWNLGIISAAMMQDESKSTALDVAMALSDGLNCLHAMIQWIDGGAAADALGIEHATLDNAMAALESAMIELLDSVKSGCIHGGPPIHESDIADVRRLRAMIAEYRSSGKMPIEGRVLATHCMTRLTGGASIRTLVETGDG